jgi:hypothetical protein
MIWSEKNKRLRLSDYACASIIDIQLVRLTPMPELPCGGRMNLARR